MLHAKFQDHRTSGSGEEDLLRFLPYGPQHEKMSLQTKFLISKKQV